MIPANDLPLPQAAISALMTSGMLAMRLPVPVHYEWPTLLPGILSSGPMLHAAGARKADRRRAVIDSVTMDMGVAARHSMTMPSPVVVTPGSLLWLDFSIHSAKGEKSHG